MRNNLRPFVAGFVVSLMLQAAGGWWLNSTRGVVTTTAVLFGMAVATTVLAAGSRRQDAVALGLGSIAGMAAALFWTGPGTIWPIVLAVATLMTAAAVWAGVAVGSLLKPRR
jgi:hypothetical protein